MKKFILVLLAWLAGMPIALAQKMEPQGNSCCGSVSH
jgi:hypothetical protein